MTAAGMSLERLTQAGRVPPGAARFGRRMARPHARPAAPPSRHGEGQHGMAIMAKPGARNEAAWVPFEWGLRFFGAAADREKRLDLERQMFALEGHRNPGDAFVRLRDEVIPAVWKAECRAILSRLRSGDISAIGREKAPGGKISEIPPDLWPADPPPLSGNAVTLLGGATWFDVRIMDRRPLPMDLAAQAYATEGAWFEGIKRHQRTPPPHIDPRLHVRLDAGYLPGEPTPTDKEARELRESLGRRIQARQFRKIERPEGTCVCPVVHQQAPSAKKRGFKEEDIRLYSLMAAHISKTPGMTVTKAAEEVLEKAAGAGTDDSRIQRLIRGYAKWRRVAQNGAGPSKGLRNPRE